MAQDNAYQQTRNRFRRWQQQLQNSILTEDSALMHTYFGTKGLGLFLVPARLSDGQPNHYRIRRLKQKIGARSMATGEVDFEVSWVYASPYCF